MANEQNWKDLPEQESGGIGKGIRKALGIFVFVLLGAILLYACSGTDFFKGGLHTPIEALADNYYSDGGTATLRLDKTSGIGFWSDAESTWNGPLTYENGWIHIDQKADEEVDLSFYVKDPDMVYYPGGDLFLFAAKEAEL